MICVITHEGVHSSMHTLEFILMQPECRLPACKQAVAPGYALQNKTCIWFCCRIANESKSGIKTDIFLQM